MKTSYTRFRGMIGLSAVSMYIVMYANVFEFSHIYSATMRIYMTILMIVPMIWIMLGAMWSMYPDRLFNWLIIVCSGLLGVGVFIAMREQVGIGDVQRMRAMIPHHSSAILTSSRANLQDSEVKELAENIIQTQEEEIATMKRLLEKVEK